MEGIEAADAATGAGTSAMDVDEAMGGMTQESKTHLSNGFIAFSQPIKKGPHRAT